jgi:hypothetical protein
VLLLGSAPTGTRPSLFPDSPALEGAHALGGGRDRAGGAARSV